MKGSNLALFAEFVGLLMDGPKTVRELAELGGDTHNPPNRTHGYLKALREEGLVYIHHWGKPNGQPVAFWGLQPTRLHFPDEGKT